MPHRFAALALLTFMLAACGPANAPVDTSQSASTADTVLAPSPDATFLNRAAMFENFEIQAATMAQAQAQAPAVKTYAAAELAAHHQALAQLNAAAAAAHMSAPAADLDDNYAAYLDMLRRAQGAAFDSTYASQQALAYINVGGTYSTYLGVASDGPLKSYAAARAPVLQQAVAAARRLGSGN